MYVCVFGNQHANHLLYFFFLLSLLTILFRFVVAFSHPVCIQFVYQGIKFYRIARKKCFIFFYFACTGRRICLEEFWFVSRSGLIIDAERPERGGLRLGFGGAGAGGW